MERFYVDEHSFKPKPLESSFSQTERQDSFLSFAVGFPSYCVWAESTWTRVQISTFLQVAIICLYFFLLLFYLAKTLFESNVTHRFGCFGFV